MLNIKETKIGICQRPPGERTSHLLALLGTQLKSQSTWFETKMLTSTVIFTSLHSLTGLGEFKYKFQNHSPPPQEMLVFIFFENENMKYRPPLQSLPHYSTTSTSTTNQRGGECNNEFFIRKGVGDSFVCFEVKYFACETFLVKYFQVSGMISKIFLGKPQNQWLGHRRSCDRTTSTGNWNNVSGH